MISRNVLIRSELARELSSSRVDHSQSVARWASVLARLHGADPSRAERAGWFHDLAKEWRSSRLTAYVRAHKIAVPHLRLILAHKRAGLLHGYVSAHLAQRRGLVPDRQTRVAMARHTLGHVRMGLLDKILYVADFSSPDRRYAQAVRVRRWARRDLDEALRLTVSYKIGDVVQRSGFLHPTTVALWNALCKEQA
ncbi:MAG: bis(5'-nucleosyl)-tetraphosphatase (symmetrical) YqeK [Elusimicrobia bacterium]|nr:bis(5'-nucleosyl)-tetraphosphatase (symmetrical) YqeK [Elusimicrobiota bacterium]